MLKAYFSKDDTVKDNQDIDVKKVREHCENKVVNDTTVVTLRAVHQNYIVNERFLRLTITGALSNIGEPLTFFSQI